jgi:antitoxin MazE
MYMRVQVQKWGNSLALRIPKSFAQETHLDQGSVVDLSLKEGEITITPVAESEYSLEELLSQVTKKNLHPEVRTGSPRGKEVW